MYILGGNFFTYYWEGRPRQYIGCFSIFAEKWFLQSYLVEGISMLTLLGVFYPRCLSTSRRAILAGWIVGEAPRWNLAHSSRCLDRWFCSMTPSLPEISPKISKNLHIFRLEIVLLFWCGTEPGSLQVPNHKISYVWVGHRQSLL